MENTALYSLSDGIPLGHNSSLPRPAAEDEELEARARKVRGDYCAGHNKIEGGMVAKKKKSIPEVKYKQVRLNEIKVDPYAKALSRSDQMKPYIECYRAIYGKDETALEIAREKVGALPLEKRYIWRILEALNWGFSDFDDETVRLDLKCLSDADRQKLNTVLQEVLSIRAAQLCLFLQVLVGTGTMKKLMEEAIEVALSHGMSAEGDENEEVN